ncbi:MAG TPA: glycosyltransferase family 39 protein [Gemmatimonadaceae bacterium]
MTVATAAPSRPSPLAALWRQIGFVCAGIVAIYCVVHAFDPPRLNWGDSGSDYNVMTAGRNFARYGFLELRLTPNLIDRSVMTAADSGLIYTHYPQLPDLMNGVFRSVLRMSDVVPFRFMALLFSFGSLAFVYALVAAFWSRQSAQLALALWVTNPLWIQHADYLHHGPYGAFFAAGSLYFLTRFLRDERTQTLLISGLFLVFTYWASYDYWIFTPALLAVITVVHYRRPLDRRVIRSLGTLAAFAVAALLLKLATNVWALGGIGPFFRDLRFQFTERATDAVVRTSYADGMVPVLFGRIDRYFSLLLFPIAALWLVFPLVRRRVSATANPANPIWLLLAALPFFLLFREMWVAQHYPFLMIVPFYAIGSAALIVLLTESSGRLMKGVGVALLVAIMGNALYENGQLQRAFFDRAAIRSLGSQLDSLAPPGQQILTNHVFDRAYRYYFNRRIVSLIGHPSRDYGPALALFSDPIRPQYASSNGALLVQHKHLAEELYDKEYYYILAPYQLWDAWAHPSSYRRFLDSLVSTRDSVLTREASRVGDKLYESDFYTLWRIRPHGRSADGAVAREH